MRSLTYKEYEILFDQGKDEALVAAFKWHVRKGKITSYAVTGNNVRMHRLLIGAKPGQIVDHINGNGLDNRRQNLRFVSAKQNCQNRKTHKNRTLPKGVSKIRDSYRARIRVNGNLIHLGYFYDVKSAALAYNKAAVMHFGEYAKLNKE